MQICFTGCQKLVGYRQWLFSLRVCLTLRYARRDLKCDTPRTCWINPHSTASLVDVLDKSALPVPQTGCYARRIILMAITFSLSPDGEVIHDQNLIAEVLREALPYIDFLKGKTLVIKLGGSTLEHQRGILQDIIWLRSLGAHPVLVHGGGPYINEWLNRLEMPAHFEHGLRITDASTLDVVRMVLLGQV